jgi:carbon storage regulator CsrA
MIVVSREVGQGIHLEVPGHGEVFVIVGRIVADRKVRLLIEAPPSMPVHTGEVYAAIQRENQSLDGR